MIEKLLTEISSINQKYTLINQKTGAFFNVFDIVGLSSDEVAICKLLSELLDSTGSHYQGDAFLRMFVSDVLQLDFTDMDYLTASVHTEYRVDRRRIDLVIISLNYMIPIEVKIYAGDQDAQCFDYSATRQNSDLYYLTLNGHLPSKASAEGLQPEMEEDEIVGYQGVRLLSFRDDITNWIGNCLALPEVIKIAPIREILLQFKDVLLNLTGQTEGGAKMEIANTLMKSAESMRTAIDIANALPDAKTGIMLNLFRELKRLFEKEKRAIYDYDEETIRQYYFSRKQLSPYLSVEITKLSDKIVATLCIEAIWELCFSFAFTEISKDGEYCEYIETERVKNDHPDIYDAFTNAVYEVVGCQGEKTAELIFWDYLNDERGRKYDFKNFSSSCADLASDYTEQASKMFETLNSYVVSIEKKLKRRS